MFDLTIFISMLKEFIRNFDMFAQIALVILHARMSFIYLLSTVMCGVCDFAFRYNWILIRSYTSS